MMPRRHPVAFYVLDITDRRYRVMPGCNTDINKLSRLVYENLSKSRTIDAEWQGPNHVSMPNGTRWLMVPIRPCRRERPTMETSTSASETLFRNRMRDGQR